MLILEIRVIQMDKIRELDRIQYELSENKGTEGIQASREEFKASNKISGSSKNFCVQRVFLRQFLYEVKK